MSDKKRQKSDKSEKRTRHRTAANKIGEFRSVLNDANSARGQPRQRQQNAALVLGTVLIGIYFMPPSAVALAVAGHAIASLAENFAHYGQLVSSNEESPRLRRPVLAFMFETGSMVLSGWYCYVHVHASTGMFAVPVALILMLVMKWSSVGVLGVAGLRQAMVTPSQMNQISQLRERKH